MALFKAKKEQYLTLKEASTLTGYSSDYIGQLIRRGKIAGKRVYANPVWMTTERDLTDYLIANRSNDSSEKRSEWKIFNRFRFWRTRVRSELEILKLYKGVLYFTIIVSLIFSLFVFYVFSVNFDAWLSQRSDRVIETVPVEESGRNESFIEF